jgi:3-phenylpropionate/trans-cinnamate dioxygenase ferredoxin reductase subunit
MNQESIVIIGASHAGVKAASVLRAGGFGGRLVLVDRDPHPPYERPPLSKGFLAGETTPERMIFRNPDFYTGQKIELRLGVSVEAIDRAPARIALAGGETLAYDRLLIATGAKARPLPFADATLSGISELRNLDDAVRIKAHLVPGAKIVIIGAGYIGLEVAAAAVKAGAQATIIEREARVMSRVTSAAVSHHFETMHREHGVALHLDRQVAAIEGRERAERVVTADGEVFAADHVVVGIGVLAADDLARAAGLACDDGILVDGHCRTSDPAIFAAGDVTRHENPILNRQVRLECVQNALGQATVAAENMLGKAESYAEVPWFWTEQYGCRLQSAGLFRPDDTMVLRGDPASGRFSVVYLRDGVMVAIDTVNALRDFMPAKKLIGERRAVAADALADPAVPLAKLV